MQTIWALYAVRRSNQFVAAGQNGRATAILNTTARTFADNPDVLLILANGYASAGMAKQAVLIWKSRDLKDAPQGDYESAVGAALSAGDLKDAETWLRFGLDHYPKDAALLVLAAKFEQARGDSNRAADYYRASLNALPAPNPGAELATELSRPAPAPTGTPTVRPGQDLATLLKPGKDDLPPTSAADANGADPNAVAAPAHPYLPSYGGGGAPVQFYVPGASDTSVPSYGTLPAPTQPTSGTPGRLRDYVPQSSLAPQPLDGARPADAMHTVAAFTDDDLSPTLVLAPAMLHSQPQGDSKEAQTISPMFYQASYNEPQQTETQTQNQTQQAAPPDTEVYQPYRPYKPGPLTAQPASAQQPVPAPVQQIQAAPVQQTTTQSQPATGERKLRTLRSLCAARGPDRSAGDAHHGAHARAA